jgi:hypothetical protein
MLKHLCSALFISSHFQKHSSPPFPHHSYSRNNSVQHLFRFSPSIAETPLAATFPVAETPATFHFPPVTETPITSNLSSVFPMLKHHCSTFFISFPPPPFSHCFHCRNNSVQHLFRRSSLLLKHLYQQPFIFLTIHHRRNNSVQHLFRLFLLLKHHLPATLHHSFMMLKHHRSTLFDFLPILKHQLSAVLHLQQFFRFFSVAETPAFHHRPSASFYALKCSHNRPST